MREAYDTVQVIFSDLSEIEHELGIAFWNFFSIFSESKNPKSCKLFLVDLIML